MNEKRKRALAGCLFIGAVITWVPELVSAGHAQKPPPKLDLPAEAAWDGKTPVHASAGSIASADITSTVSASTRSTMSASTGSSAPASAPGSSARDSIESPRVSGSHAESSHAESPAAAAFLQPAARFQVASTSAESAAAPFARAPDSRNRAAPTGSAEEDLVSSMERSLAVVRSVQSERAPLDIEALAETWSRTVGRRTQRSDAGAGPGLDASPPRRNVRE